MKKLYFLALLCFAVAPAQNINFADANLKAMIVSANTENGIARDLDQNYIVVDTNGDGEIQVSEALTVYHLLVGMGEISSMAGIEAFTNLRTLECSMNNLTTLDVSALTNLRDLSCGSNQLTSLDVSGLPQLEFLYCGDNQLTNLNVQGCTMLYSLDFGYNNLTSIDLSGMTNLNDLMASDNQLTSLDLSGLAALDYLDCNYNQLTSLNIQGCSNLFFLQCYNNNLTTLDVSGSNPEVLDCADNQLVSLIIKNGYDNSDSFYDFGNNPLEYLCVDEVEFDAYVGILDFYGLDSEINTYCYFGPGGADYVLQGNNSFDFNLDGCDSNDYAFPNLRFNVTDGSNTGLLISDGSGTYTLPLTDGIHTLTPILENPEFFDVSPTSVTVNFPVDVTPAVRNFCVSANGIHPDLEIAVVPLEAAVPGFDASYSIVYRNKGNQLMSGSVMLTFDGDVMDVVSSEPAPNDQSPNTLMYDFTDLNPFRANEIIVTFNLNAPTETPPLNLDDQLAFTATVTAVEGDENPLDNTFTYDETLVGSFDPNDIACLEGEVVGTAMVGEYVHYVIRFENTGTFPAQNIVIRNEINPSELDISSLVPIRGSHDFYTVTNGNVIEFYFDNIQLPFADDVNDGYILYKIRTNSNLVAGSTFSNSAGIYFDFNYPIQTNTFTTLVQALSASDFDFDRHFTLYPNPARNSVTLRASSGLSANKITLYNMLGQPVAVIANPSLDQSIDISRLQSGTYLVKLETDKGSVTARFVKN